MSVFKDDQTTYTGNVDILGNLNVHGDITAGGSSSTSGAIRVALGADTTFWVRSDGSDSNTGLTNTAAGAMLTWNALYTRVVSTYDFKGHTITLKSGTTNTYAAGLFMTVSWVGSGQLIVDLNGCSIAETVTKGIINDVVQPGQITIQNSAGLGTGGVVSSAGFAGIQNDQACDMNIGSGITVGTCFDAGFEATQNGNIFLTAPINVSGSGGHELVLTAQGSNFAFNGQTVNFMNDITYNVATVVAQSSSYIAADSATFNLNGHTITGPRYSALGGQIFTGNAGQSFFPGTTAGILGDGGIYDGSIGVSSVATNGWMVDGSGVADIVIAASSSSADFAIGGGLIMVCDLTTTGQTALFYCAAGVVTKIVGDANWSATTTPGAGAFGIGFSGTFRYRIYNGSGATRHFSCMTIKAYPAS